MRQLLFILFIFLTGADICGQINNAPPVPEYDRSEFNQSIGFHNTNRHAFLEDYNTVFEYLFDDDFTIEFWIKISSSIEPGALVLRTSNFDINFGMGVDANGNYTPGLVFLTRSWEPDPRWENAEDYLVPGTNHYHHLTAQDIPYFNDWFHVAIVRSRSAVNTSDNMYPGNMRMYINGTSSEYPVYGPLEDLLPLDDGGIYMAPYYTSYLKMDELRIWNMARTTQQIHDHMNQPISNTTAGLIAYYSFDGLPPGAITIPNTARGTGAPLTDDNIDDHPLYGTVGGYGPAPFFGTDREYISEAEGDWDDPDTWGGEVPGEDEIVIINQTVTLTGNRTQHGLVFRAPDIAAARMSGAASGDKLVFTNGHTLTLKSPPAGGNASSYVATDNGGTLIVENIPYTGTQIPVGTESAYRPVFIAQPTTTSYDFISFSIRAEDEILPAVSAQAAVVDASWDLTPLTANPSPAPYRIKFQWNGADERNNFSRGDAYVANHHNGSWNILTSEDAETINSTTYALAATVSQFSPFIITSDQTSLPVRLTSFNVAQEGQTALLTWSASDAENFTRFEIERSPDADTWVTIGTEHAAGQGREVRHYTFHDPLTNVLSQRLYYRIKMIDFDNSYAYSPIKTIAWKASARLSVYPNPAERKSEVRLKFSGDLSNADLKIISLNGFEVHRQRGLTNGLVKLPDLPTGIYIISVDQGGQVHKEKILIR